MAVVLSTSSVQRPPPHSTVRNLIDLIRTCSRPAVQMPSVSWCFDNINNNNNNNIHFLYRHLLLVPD